MKVEKEGCQAFQISRSDTVQIYRDGKLIKEVQVLKDLNYFELEKVLALYCGV